MNQTDERVESIEHLDHTPSCGNDSMHPNGGPKADYWVSAHGCVELFACKGCVQAQREWFENSAPNGVDCDTCGGFFPTFESAHTVVPL